MVTLWGVPASHPVMAVQRALELKGVAFRRVDLVPVLARAVVGARFHVGTVPAVTFPDGARVQGSRPILEALEQRVPEPPLAGADPETRLAAEWGEQVLQPIVRRLAWWCLGEHPAAMEGYLAGTRTVPPAPALARRALAPAIARAARRLNGVDEQTVRSDLRHLPRHLNRVDDWIAGGHLDGERLTGADLHVGTSLRLALTLGDVAPVIAGRPCERLARRVVPAWPGATPAGAVSSDWVPAA